MNSAPVLPVWLHLLGLLAVEGTLVIGLAATLARLTSSADWRRATWHACMVGLIVLTGFELSGAGREVAACVIRKASPSPAAPSESAGAKQGRPGAAESGQLTDHFRDKVAERLAE